MASPKWGVDLQSEHERYLTEKYAKKPVTVMNYPKAEVLDRSMGERGIDKEHYAPSLTLPRLRGREGWGASSAPSPMSPVSRTCATRSRSRAPPATPGTESHLSSSLQG